MTPTVWYAVVILVAYAIYVGWANWYARRRFPRVLCSPCKGTGKKWEPKALQMTRLSFFKRRYRKCLPCDGTGFFEN